jgi:hypothetical protein
VEAEPMGEKRGAWINRISPVVIITPLANDDLSGPRGEANHFYFKGSYSGPRFQHSSIFRKRTRKADPRIATQPSKMAQRKVALQPVADIVIFCDRPIKIAL